MIEAAMIWNEPNNKSHWDLEADPGWKHFARLAKLAGAAIGTEAPGLKRVMGGMSPIDPGFLHGLAAQGGLDEVDAVAVHGFPLDWNHWLIDEWPAKLQTIAAATDLPVWVSELGISSFGAEEVQEWGLRRSFELLHGQAPRLTGTACLICHPPGPPPPGTAKRKALPITGTSTWVYITNTAARNAPPAFSMNSRQNSASANGSTSRTIAWKMRCDACASSALSTCAPV